MFTQFRDFFNIPTTESADKRKKDVLLEFRNEFQGMEFGEGIYRVFKIEDISKWKKIITDGYPDFKGKFEPFGFDWLGRCFAIDLRRKTKGQVLMFEIGTAAALEIPCDIITFHNNEIPNNGEACLAKTFFHQWRESNEQKIHYSECVGYKVPLFLNGEDTIENLELSDMDVYWSLLSQTKNRV